MKKLLFILCFLSITQLKAQSDEETTELLRQYGIRTAKQTWWFFDMRLKNPLEYSFQHVYIDFLHAYIKDIKQLPSGKYTGKVNLDLPHDPAYTESNQEITFDSLEIDDWFMVDNHELVGGFYIRTLSSPEKQQIKKLGDFFYMKKSINDDFIESSAWPRGSQNTNEEKCEFFKGGQAALLDSLMKKIYYTDYARMMGIEGHVTIGFTIDETGEISHVKVLRGVGGGLNDVAKDVIYQLKGNWQSCPLINKTIYLKIPIVFRLNY